MAADQRCMLDFSVAPEKANKLCRINQDKSKGLIKSMTREQELQVWTEVTSKRNMCHWKMTVR